MPSFTSKLQYKNYEQGEFIDEAERTPDEIADIIHSYPWAKECHNVPVGLTAPSITIQDEQGAYLKVSHSYNGKFSLYLLDANGACSKKVVNDLDYAGTAAIDFCNGTLSEDGFTSDITFQARKYFITKDFRFHVAKGAMFPIIIYTIVPTMVITSVAVFMLLFQKNLTTQNQLIITLKVVLCTMSLLLGYITITAWRLYFNHYNYSRDQFIEISAGRNEFMFGTDNNYKVYKKDEITHITVYRNTQSRNPSSHIELLELTFNDGSQVNISSLLLKHAYTKFPGVKMDWVSRFFPKIS